MAFLLAPESELSTHLLANIGDRNTGILAAAASGLCTFIDHYGGDADRILGISGIDPEHLQHPTQSLGLLNYCKVLEEAARQCDCDNFGLYYGHQFKPQALGLLGYIGLCSSTVEQALINVARAFPYHQHNSLTCLVDDGECYRFDYQVRHSAIIVKRQDAELSLGIFNNLIRQAFGSNWAPRAVHFEHPRPESWHDHSRLFNAPVYFSQPCNSLLIPKSNMGRKMPGSDPILLMVMQDAIRQLNNYEKTPPNIVDNTKVQVRHQLLNGEPTLEAIAAGMGLTSCSLQRRLRDQGLPFTVLVDKTRCELATHYLQLHQLPISELAPLLGYSEASAFSRAFRRWFGVSPRQWRQHNDLLEKQSEAS
ncbi:AraC-like transcriptional regulator QhpR [Pseudomonas fragi]|uniref:AraC family transcriptional regulator n=1 Tax=Pseudomonas fragi TaxID=296 RepID=A0A449ISG5_PSEFR|nr:AraC family transcriptional regulator [Pseudomonas fragi]VFB22319.1 AraC family transcriptional regulator [Pseudomonas fragi]